MKPSQFKRIEKKAEQQWGALKVNIKKAETLGQNLAVEQNKESLNNLITTMKELKKK